MLRKGRAICLREREMGALRFSKRTTIPCAKDRSFLECVCPPFFSESRCFRSATAGDALYEEEVFDDGHYQKWQGSFHQHHYRQPMQHLYTGTESILQPATFPGCLRQHPQQEAVQQVVLGREAEPFKLEGAQKEALDVTELAGFDGKYQSFQMCHDEEVGKLLRVVHGKAVSTGLEDALDELGIHITPFHISKILKTVVDLDIAIRVFIWADKHDYYAHNLVTFTCLVNKLAHAKQFDRIWDLLTEIQGAGFALHDGPFNTLVKGYGEVGNVDKAMLTFIEMVKFGVPPTSYSFNTLLKVLLKAQKFEIAMEIFQELLACPILLDDFSFNMIVKALCQNGQLQKALKVVSDMKLAHLHMGLITWTTLIHGFCNAGKVMEALELFSDMKNAGIKPNVITYTVLLKGLCRVGKIDNAMAHLKCMTDEGCRPNAITHITVMHGFCKAGRIDDACKFLTELENSGEVNQIVFSILVDCFCKLGRMDEACEMCDRMVRHGYMPNVGTYNLLMQGLFKAGRVKEAFRCFKKMKRNKCVPNAAVFNVMVKGLSKAGWKNEAEQVLRTMVSEGFAATSASCSALSSCKGSLDGACKLFDQMKKQAEVTVCPC